MEHLVGPQWMKQTRILTYNLFMMVVSMGRANALHQMSYTTELSLIVFILYLSKNQMLFLRCPLCSSQNGKKHVLFSADNLQNAK